MTSPLISRDQYDHPEHFDDAIRGYRSSKRYIPTPLENHLFQLAGHRCTICRAPWLEVHHIDGLGEGGQTSFDNLVALCPNCHTRVHSEGVPSKLELRQYKLKQEIAYELPVLGRMQLEERSLVQELITMGTPAVVTWERVVSQNYDAPTAEDAVRLFRQDLGYFHLQESGMLTVDRGLVVVLADGRTSVNLELRLTSKGIRWLHYLKESGPLPW